MANDMANDITESAALRLMARWEKRIVMRARVREALKVALEDMPACTQRRRRLYAFMLLTNRKNWPAKDPAQA